MFIGIILAACGSNSTQKLNNPEELVKAYIAAYEAKDTSKILALYDKDAIYMDQGSPANRSMGEMYVRNITTAWAETFNDPIFEVKFLSYFISHDGTHAALTTTYTNKNRQGNPVSVPMMIILEIREGKIVREDDYYDFTPFE